MIALSGCHLNNILNTAMTPVYPSFTNWLMSSEGDYLRRREQAWFDETIADVFGFNAVQIGLPQWQVMRNCRVRHQVCLDISPFGDIQGDPLNLPFASQSLDLLVLPHTLEFSVAPHQILREAERVLIAEGHLMLSGFNPWSLWGLYHWHKQRRGKFLWQADFVTPFRLRDWLSLLACETAEQRQCCYVPPLAHRRWVPWFEAMEKLGGRRAFLGGVYFLHAIKRVHGMHLITPRWLQAPVAVRPALRPTPRALQAENTAPENHLAKKIL